MMRLIFSHKLLLTNTQVSSLHKAFANSSSANTKLSETHLHEIGQSGGFLGKIVEPLLKPLAKSVLIPLGVTAAVSATHAAIKKKIFGSCMTTIIISNEEINDIMKIIQSPKGAGLLIKCVSQTTKSEAKELKGRFLSMLLDTLGASLLGNLIKGKGFNW